MCALVTGVRRVLFRSRAAAHVEMKMIVVETIRVGTKTNGKTPASGSVRHAQKIADAGIGSAPAVLHRDSAPVGQDERRNVGGIGARMFAKTPPGRFLAGATGVPAPTPDLSEEIY